MSEIKFSKEKYDKKLEYLNYMYEFIDVNPSWMISKGACDSPAINDFEEIYELLRVSVRDYVWSLDNLIESLANAGNALYDMDKNISSDITNS